MSVMKDTLEMGLTVRRRANALCVIPWLPAPKQAATVRSVTVILATLETAFTVLPQRNVQHPAHQVQDVKMASVSALIKATRTLEASSMAVGVCAEISTNAQLTRITARN